MTNLKNSLSELLEALNAVIAVKNPESAMGYATIRAISEQIEAAAMLVREDLAV